MECAYCGSDEKEKSFLTCMKCQKCIHVSCVKMGCVPGGLIGDAFFDFVCFECNGFSKETLIRQKIPWFIVIALTLYNLHKRSEGVSLKGHFHYKMHIVNFIDRHWNILFVPLFKRKKSWTGTVSGTLSHFCPIYFLNGNEVLKDSGWWRLTNPSLTPQELMEIHTKYQAAKRKGGKQSVKSSESNSLQNSAASSPTPGTCDELSLPAYDSSSAVSASTDLLGDDEALKAPDPTFSIPNFGSNEEFSNYLFNENEDLSDMDLDMGNVNPLVLNAPGSASFQDLDYLLRPDCVVLPECESTNHSFSSGQTEDPLFLNPGGKFISEDFMSIKQETPHGSVYTGTDDGSSEHDDAPPVQEKILAKSLFEVTPPEKRIPPWEVKEEEEEQQKIPPETMCLPMSEYEELQLLGELRRASSAKELTGDARRLYRKLCVRRIKRERGLPLFNLDNMFRPGRTLYQSGSVWTRPSRTVERMDTTEARILDRFHHVDARTVGRGKRQMCSFKFKLMGGAEPTCFISPFTHRQLKPYIWRDYETTPLWLKLLHEIQSRANRNNPGWMPPPRSPIDYCYVRHQHISTINSLCSEFFYPGIDLSEVLQYPDFSCVALYKKLIIAFAFMVPDVGYNETYISFLFTRPEWRGSGIATFMLYHLIQTCMGKDVTLHVSATNPAVILYQKFGFKVQEFVQDFYDKYFPADSKECKHALFLRLTR